MKRIESLKIAQKFTEKFLATRRNEVLEAQLERIKSEIETIETLESYLNPPPKKKKNAKKRR